MRKSTHILYVTFARDRHWLRYSLESACKFATGFSGITVVVPTWDLHLFKEFERYSKPDCPVTIKDFVEYPGKGFVHHLAMKLYADVLIPDADYILHMDPDCLFHAPVTPEDYIIGGYPVLVIEPYEALKTAHPARYNWKQVTEHALGCECKYETMCRHPAVHYRETYRGLRNFIEHVHSTPFLDFVLRQKNNYPQGFGEFNTIGSYALIGESEYEYHLIDRRFDGDKNDPPSKVTQMWSYTGVGKNLAQIEKILNGNP